MLVGVRLGLLGVGFWCAAGGGGFVRGDTLKHVPDRGADEGAAAGGYSVFKERGGPGGDALARKTGARGWFVSDLSEKSW